MEGKCSLPQHITEMYEMERSSVKQDKQDRRSLRTRHLCSRYMELLLERRYEVITVRDIWIGRDREFDYCPYFDKEMCKRLIEHILEHFQSSRRETAGRDIIQAWTVSTYQEHSQHFQAIVGVTQKRRWEGAQTTLSRTIEQPLQQLRRKTFRSVPLAVVLNICRTLLNLLNGGSRLRSLFTGTDG